MNKVGSIERITQNRVVKLFQEELAYTYLGDWQEDRENSNIEEEYLTKYLLKRGYNAAQITKAIYVLKTTANNFSDSLYTANKNVYELLRYGVNVKTEVGKNADLILMKGDLSKEISSIRNMEIVFKNGVGFDSKKIFDAVKGKVGAY